MGFEFPLNKLGVINRALQATANNLVNAADDGSDEWNAASPAYETALGYMIDTHTWSYTSKVVTLTPSPTAPANTDWDTAYPIPSDLIHIIWVKINRDLTATQPLTTNQLTLWDIEGSPSGPVIVINAKGGPPPPTTPVTPGVVTLKYIANSVSFAGPEFGTPIFVAALIEFTKGGIYESLNEDLAAANTSDKKAMVLLQEARTRFDQQKPKRQFFNPRITASRRIRRPWPPQGIDNWGGSNIPG